MYAENGHRKHVSINRRTPKPMQDLFSIRQSILTQIRNREGLPLRKTEARDRYLLQDATVYGSGSSTLRQPVRVEPIGSLDSGSFPLPSPPLPPPPDFPFASFHGPPQPQQSNRPPVQTESGYQSSNSFKNIIRIHEAHAARETTAVVRPRSSLRRIEVQKSFESNSPQFSPPITTEKRNTKETIRLSSNPTASTVKFMVPCAPINIPESTTYPSSMSSSAAVSSGEMEHHHHQNEMQEEHKYQHNMIKRVEMSNVSPDRNRRRAVKTRNRLMVIVPTTDDLPTPSSPLRYSPFEKNLYSSVRSSLNYHVSERNIKKPIKQEVNEVLPKKSSPTGSDVDAAISKTESQNIDIYRHQETMSSVREKPKTFKKNSHSSKMYDSQTNLDFPCEPELTYCTLPRQKKQHKSLQSTTKPNIKYCVSSSTCQSIEPRLDKKSLPQERLSRRRIDVHREVSPDEAPRSLWGFSKRNIYSREEDKTEKRDTSLPPTSDQRYLPPHHYLGPWMFKGLTHRLPVNTNRSRERIRSMSVSRKPSHSLFNSAAASRMELNQTATVVQKVDRMISPTPPTTKSPPNKFTGLQRTHRAPSECYSAYQHNRFRHPRHLTCSSLDPDEDDGEGSHRYDEIPSKSAFYQGRNQDEDTEELLMPRKFGSLGRHDDSLIRSYLQRNSSELHRSQIAFVPRFGSMRIRSEAGQRPIPSHYASKFINFD